MGPTRLLAATALLCGAAALLEVAGAGELSAHDELRALYSDRFSFTDDGLPLVTIEIMSGQDRVALAARRGVTVLPRGEGGSTIRGARGWIVTVEHARPARVKEWTVVEHLAFDDAAGIDAAVARWTKRGYHPRAFEIGTVFGVEGEVIDSREALIGVAPARRGRGARRSRELATRWHLDTSVYPELARRPSGTLVATSADGAIEIRAASVLWFEPTAANATIEVADVVHGGGGSQPNAERRDDRRYWGRIYVTVGNDGKLVVVNAVTADKLLAGLVPAEIFADAPAEALAAQAIAARTELLSRIGTRHFAEPYLLCSSQHCQVYSGAGHEHPRTTRAVRDTRGQVLLRGTGGLVDARYSASCGGHSEDNDSIWGGAPDPALRGRLDLIGADPASARRFAGGVTDRNLDTFLAIPRERSYCGATKYARGRYRWTARIDPVSLRRRVRARYGDVGRILALEPLERGVSGRIRQLRIRGARRTVVARGDLRIRRLLGGLKSTLFHVAATGPAQAPTGFVVHGAGFGHGVGMCQTGAIGRAEAGQNHRQILGHYYAGSRVHRLY